MTHRFRLQEPVGGLEDFLTDFVQSVFNPRVESGVSRSCQEHVDGEKEREESFQ
jgi:hypothetical protein